MLTNKEYANLLKRADSRSLTDSERSLFVAIATRINEDYYCEASNAELAEHLKCCLRAVTKWVSSLDEKHFIDVRFVRHKHQRRIYVPGLGEKSWYIEPAYEDLSEAQKKFKQAFPDRAIDCDVPAEVDMDALIEKIHQSKKRLMQYTGMTLKSFVKYYDRIMRGDYDDNKGKDKDQILKDAKRLGVI